MTVDGEEQFPTSDGPRTHRSRLLACVDFSTATAAIAEQVVRLALALEADVRLLYVAAPEPDFVGYGPGPSSVRQNVADQLREEHRSLERLAAELSAAGISVMPLMVQGSTAATIIDQAARFGADWVVMGSHGHGAVYELLVGSVTQEVLRDTRVPVLVVPVRGRS